MGLFWNRKKNDASPPPAPAVQQAQPKEAPVKAALPSPAPSSVQLQQTPTPRPEPAPKQESVPVEQAKPTTDIEMRKIVFRLTSHDPAKCDAFIKEMLRKVNKHDWHTLSGRIGKNTDGVKMRMDIKGKHDDIENFLKWCRTDHFGVHAYELHESKALRMPYPTNYPPFQEQLSSWPTS